MAPVLHLHAILPLRNASDPPVNAAFQLDEQWQRRLRHRHSTSKPAEQTKPVYDAGRERGQRQQQRQQHKQKHELRWSQRQKRRRQQQQKARCHDNRVATRRCWGGERSLSVREWESSGRAAERESARLLMLLWGSA